MGSQRIYTDEICEVLGERAVMEWAGDNVSETEAIDYFDSLKLLENMDQDLIATYAADNGLS